MNIEAYHITAMIVRYILVAIVFMVFIEAVLQSRKSRSYDSSETIATLWWEEEDIEFYLSQENLIGKSNRCDIVVKARGVKRIHGQIYFDSDEWIICANSRSLIYVNEVLIEDKALIEDGDVIGIGDESLVFELEEKEMVQERAV